MAAVHALNAHPERHWTPRSLAREMGVSVSLLYELFSAGFGVPPMGYLRTIRIHISQRLLSETDQSIPIVAEQAGFASESHFCRVFRELVGISPLQYRKNARLSGIHGNL